jgi:hypothetical protein
VKRISQKAGQHSTCAARPIYIDVRHCDGRWNTGTSQIRLTETRDQVEYALAERIEWCDQRHRYSYCADLPPTESETRYNRQQRGSNQSANSKGRRSPDSPGDSLVNLEDAG